MQEYQEIIADPKRHTAAKAAADEEMEMLKKIKGPK
jgi:hypothetical protein